MIDRVHPWPCAPANLEMRDSLVIRARNVNDAFVYACALARSSEMDEVVARGSKTLEWPMPMLTTYAKPAERVLFNTTRDANPFFHFFEPLWMLAGRDDVSFPAALVKRMASFSDDGKVFRGAYGARWRGYGDQIKKVVKLLRREPGTRRAVLQIFDAWQDLDVDSKDIPCNTTVYFKVREGQLRLTVCCRSNDILWGAYGANVTQFSMLQEYVADKVGVDVGPMVQLSDSWHVYIQEGHAGAALWDKLCETPPRCCEDPYADGIVSPYSLSAQDDAWDDDLRAFFQGWDELRNPMAHVFQTPYFRHVVTPMWQAWKNRSQEALMECHASDWRHAGLEWLQRRGDK